MTNMNKKGIELSVNFLVMFILAIVIFGLGIVFLYNIFGSATTAADMNWARIDRMVGDMLCPPQTRVCVSNNDAQITRGELSAHGIFVYNFHNDPVTVTLNVSFNSAYSNNQEFFPETVPQVLLLSSMEGEILNPATQHRELMGVLPQKDINPGTYEYDVFVRYYNQDTGLQIGQTERRKLVLRVR